MKRSACALAAWAVVFARAPLARGDPAASCVAERAGDRAEARVSLAGLFDEELLRLVRLGLRGQIQLEVTLYRSRRFWFDERRAMETRDAVVSWSRDQRYTLDGRPVGDPSALTLAPVSLRSVGEGVHYVEVTARLEVVTAKSLRQMATWLVRGNDDSEEETSRLGRGLVSYVAAGLVRTAATRCRVD